jgi:hypothetical protein
VPNYVYATGAAGEKLQTQGDKFIGSFDVCKKPMRHNAYSADWPIEYKDGGNRLTPPG